MKTPNEIETKKYLDSYSETGVYALEKQLFLLRFNDGVLLSGNFELLKTINNQ